MVLLHSLKELHNWQREVNWNTQLTGFVPTMGALHEGHLALIQKAASQNELVVVSVLVNPTQFNDNEDFESYPRTLDSDAKKAASAGADALFAPTAEDLYQGQPSAPRVDWGPVTNAFEGAHRPGHFDGVVAVVDLLFEAVKPSMAVFGEKDLQQVAVVKRLASERHPGLTVVVGDLVRDSNGLALSSRNARLGEQGLVAARALHDALQALKDACLNGMSLEVALAAQRASLEGNPEVALEYLEVVNAITFEKATEGEDAPRHAIVAASVNGVRLIDNVALTT